MRGSLRKMIHAAVFCAVLIGCSQLMIVMPGGMALTLQTLAVALCGYCLGWRMGAASVTVYLLLGGCGLPVFSGFSGGLGRLLGPAGGFLFGFLLLVVGCGLPMKRRWLSVCCGMAGLLLCHLCGAVWYAFSIGSSFWQAALVASLPYLLKDVACVWLAELIGNKIGFFKKRY